MLQFLLCKMRLPTRITVAVATFILLAAPSHQEDSSDEVSDDTPDFDGANNVTFYLFTQSNPTTEEFIRIDDDSTSPSFNAANPTRLAVHGWIANVSKLLGIKDAYIATGDELNVILVDWSGLAAQAVPAATKSAVLVGDYIGKVLNHLIDARGLNPDDLTIIGHSMGGHIAGIAGNRVGGGIASEVIALDPAYEIFDDNPLEDQLDISDAKFVQVLHTNGGGLGELKSRGDVDFFPDGGSHQASCSDSDEAISGCSHNIVVDYFAESIIAKDFVSTRCDSYSDYVAGSCSTNDHIVMGEWTPHNKQGQYYLVTNTEYPYAKGQTDL